MASIRIGQAAAHVRRVHAIRERLIENIIAAEAASLQEAQQELIKAAQGNLSTAEQRRLDHPFAVRAPQPEYDFATINDQGGMFSRSWQSDGPHEFGTTGGDRVRIVGSVINVDPIAVFMFGTSKMVPRPIVQQVISIIAPNRLARVRQAIADTITQTENIK